MAIHYHEALQEAERLTKVLGQPHIAVREDCDCDYSRMCGRCAGEGQYYDVIRQTVLRVESAPLQSCAHVAIEQEESEAA